MDSRLSFYSRLFPQRIDQIGINSFFGLKFCLTLFVWKTMSQRLYSDVVSGTSSGSEAELLQDGDGRNLRVNWLHAYQLEDEDDALQRALSLSQVTCLESICQSIIVRCRQIFTSSLIF